jgi:hypothetical protein
VWFCIGYDGDLPHCNITRSADKHTQNEKRADQVTKEDDNHNIFVIQGASSLRCVTPLLVMKSACTGRPVEEAARSQAAATYWLAQASQGHILTCTKAAHRK